MTKQIIQYLSFLSKKVYKNYLSLPITLKISICISIIPIVLMIPISLFINDAQMFLISILMSIAYILFLVPELISLLIMSKDSYFSCILYFFPWICALVLGALPLLNGRIVAISIILICYSFLKVVIGLQWFTLKNLIMLNNFKSNEYIKK